MPRKSLESELVTARELRAPFSKALFVQKIETYICLASKLESSSTQDPQFKQWKRDVEVLLRHAFGDETTQVYDFINIRYTPACYSTSDNHSLWINSYQKGLSTAISTLKSICKEVEDYFTEEHLDASSNQLPEGYSRKVFIVHGHDETLRVKLEATLTKLGFRPVVLRNQPNRFRTILEKFEDYADVGFAVILLTADDIGYDKTKQGTEKYRARQNVVLEMGYFLARLGRNRLMAIHDPGVELPGDISGVVYTDSSNDAQWQVELVRELKAAGYDVDGNKLF